MSLTDDQSLNQTDYIDLMQLTHLSEKTDISVDPDCSDMNLSSISVTLDDRFD